MHFSYTPVLMLKRIRNLLVVMEEGTVNRAARRLGVAQPTLSRQIQSLEQEFGAQLFERGSWGMRPTDLGFYVRDIFSPIISDYDLAAAEIHAFAQGRHQQLRVGYIGLAAAKYLNPALAKLKLEFPDLKFLLFDQTPLEQVKALHEGQIDVAIIGQEGAALADDFYQRCSARLKVIVVLPIDHPLSSQTSISLSELGSELFVGVAEEAVPGRNNWITHLCSKAGFSPRFIAQTNDVSETFTLVASERAVALLPDYIEGVPPPGITYSRLSDKWARWSLYVLRQRGRGSAAGRRLVEIIGK